MDAKIALIQLKAAAAYVKLQAASSVQGLSASTEYVLLKATAVTGEFLKFLNLYETVAIDESTFFAVSKVLDDLAESEDQLSQRVSKVFHESLTVADVIDVELGRDAQDLIAIGDVITYKQFSKRLRDVGIATDDFDGEATVNDDQSMAFIKQRNDLITAGDLLHVVSSFHRAFDEDSTVADAQHLLVGKSPSEDLATVESAIVAFGKRLRENADAQDAKAYVLEKPFAERRFVDEGPFVSDAEGYAVDYFAENYVGDHGPIKTVGKVFGEALSKSEDYTFAIGKGLLDSAAYAEGLVFDIEKATSDSAAVSDLPALLTSRPAASSASSSDAVGVETGKAFTEAHSMLDTANLEIHLRFASALATSENFTLNRGGVFTNTSTDASTVADVSTSAVEKVLADSVGKGDSGSLRMTDYCDVMYFAEDFVGVSQSI